MENQTRPRAVFAPDDFRIIREALAHYIKTVQGPDSVKCANLYHRLGRVTGEAPASAASA